jgi:hypothetical protein
MEAAYEITRLCESWWGKFADTTKVDQHRFAEQLLRLMGWANVAPMESKPVLSHLGSISYILRAAQTSVAAHFVMPGALEPPSSLFKRGLDFCETTRLLVNETRAMNLDYAFITDLYRSYLYDARTDELLLRADSPTEFRRDMVGVLSLSGVEHGSLEETRRPPRSEVARRLHEWCNQWSETIVTEGRLTDEAGALAIDRLLVLRYLFEHDILRRTGWRLRRRFSEIVGRAFSSDPRGSGKQLCSLFHDIWFDWKASVFAANPALDSVLENDRIAVPLLKESALHSRTKFTIATILESFNYGDAAEKARVRMVPDANEDRESLLAQQSLASIDNLRIEIDLADEGYRAIFHWFDNLVDLYDRMSLDFDAQTDRVVPREGEMDLFEWSEIAAKRPQALGEKFQYAIERGMTIYYSSPRQLRTARLMLYLHLISRYHQSKQRFTHFPNLDGVFNPRPKVLETDRKWIYSPPAADAEEWVG